MEERVALTVYSSNIHVYIHQLMLTSHASQVDGRDRDLFLCKLSFLLQVSNRFVSDWLWLRGG